MAVKAIETHYAGCRFRSRLEARWAVFFDRLGIKWRYEPEGYEIEASKGISRHYLPDFYLPGPDIWVEVKGDQSRLDWALIGCAVDAFSRSGLPDSMRAYSGCMEGPRGPWVDTPGRRGSSVLILGDIPPRRTDGNVGQTWAHVEVVNEKGVAIRPFVFANPGSWSIPHEYGCFDASWGNFNEQPFWSGFTCGCCNDHIFTAGGAPSIHGHSTAAHCHDFRLTFTEALNRTAKVERAYDAARMARFEHGESG